MIPFRFTFLGTGGTIPTNRRALAAFYVVRGGDKWLFDCGEGTQRQLWAATGGLPDIDGIFLTHYHADHTMGLPSIIATMHLYGRTRPITVYGPGDVRENLNAHVALMPKAARKLIRWVPLQQAMNEVAADCDEYTIRSFQVKHAGGKACGYAIQEATKAGKIDAALCSGAGLSGPEMGRVKGGETVKGVRPEDVMGPPQPGRKVVITGDTAPCKAIREWSYEADLLVHDSTFLKGQMIDKDHSTAEDAGATARQAQVKMLACAHIGARNSSAAIREEAVTAHGNPAQVHVPRDLDSYVLLDPRSSYWEGKR